MPTLEEQIKADADKYLDIIKDKFRKFEKAMVPVPKAAGEAYIRAYKKQNGKPYVLQLSRYAIAYLYKKLYDESVGQGISMKGDLAVAYSKLNPDELATPHDPVLSDPNWDPKKAYTNTVMLAFWDESKTYGIIPFKETIGASTVELFDDWHQELP